MIYITGCSVDFRRFDGFDDTGEPCSLYSDTLKRTNVYGRRNFGKSCDMFLFPFVHKEWFFKSDNILDIAKNNSVVALKSQLADMQVRSKDYNIYEKDGVAAFDYLYGKNTHLHSTAVIGILWMRRFDQYCSIMLHATDNEVYWRDDGDIMIPTGGTLFKQKSFSDIGVFYDDNWYYNISCYNSNDDSYNVKRVRLRNIFECDIKKYNSNYKPVINFDYDWRQNVISV